MTVKELVNASSGCDFVITYSVKGLLRYRLADEEKIPLYYGNAFNIPDYLLTATVRCWNAGCEYKNPKYNGAVMIIIR